MGRKSGTPYDDAFRTMLQDCSELIIPVVNEIFGTHYTGKEEVILSKNEYYLSDGDGQSKRVTDSSFAISTTPDIRYHFECQSSADNYILVRMLEYDTTIAKADGTESKYKIKLKMPRSAVLFLRSDGSDKDHMDITFEIEDSEFTHEIRILRTQDYSLDKLFEKKLYFLLPFVNFTHEKDFALYNDDEEKLLRFVDEQQHLVKTIRQLHTAGELTERQEQTILQTLSDVTNALTIKYAEIQEVIPDMYGEPYETEYMKMRREALTEGRAAEREEILEKLGLTEDAYNQILEGKRKYVLQEVVQPYNAD